jgi:glycerol-3-phosphate dehydrogenase
VSSPIRYLTVDAGGPVHVADFGGAGPAMILVHGLGGSCVNWLAVGSRLAERARVLALDLPGFGRTPPAGRAAGLLDHQACVHHVLATLAAGPVILVGNSMGGLVAMLEAARHPEGVAGLVLVAPAQPPPAGGRIDTAVLAVFALYALPGIGPWYLRRRAARLGPEGLVREVLELLCVDPSRVPGDVRAAHVALAAERLATMPWSDAAFLQAARSILSVVRRRRRYEAMVRQVRAPALLIQGSADRLVPLAASRALASQRPDWALEVLGDIGHVPQMEAPERFVDLVESWLDRQAPAIACLRSPCA